MFPCFDWLLHVQAPVFVPHPEQPVRHPAAPGVAQRAGTAHQRRISGGLTRRPRAWSRSAAEDEHHGSFWRGGGQSPSWALSSFSFCLLLYFIFNHFHILFSLYYLFCYCPYLWFFWFVQTNCFISFGSVLFNEPFTGGIKSSSFRFRFTVFLADLTWCKESVWIYGYSFPCSVPARLLCPWS